MRIQFKKVLIAAVTLLLSPSVLFAAEGAAAGNNRNNGSYNTTLVLLAGLSLILLFVIAVLANVKRQLSEICKEKFRQRRIDASVKSIAMLLAFCAVSLHSFAADAVAAPKAAVATTIISGVTDSDFYLIMTVIALEFVVIFALLGNIRRLQNVISNKTLEESNPEYAAKVAQKSWFWDKFNSAATLEQERDVLLDHNYDGIQELDNSLPPWWKYGFYITIVAAFIYFFRYQVTHTGLNSKEEYAEEMQLGEEQKAAFLAKAGNAVDENTVTLLTDAPSLAEGKEIFLKNCSPCHLPDGGGIVGPNLTDDYWLHGGSIKDVFKTIKYGYMDKGMKSWKDDFSPKQIQELASFVKSLRGTKPATPKAPQGELYVEAGAPAAAATPATDTTKKK